MAAFHGRQGSVTFSGGTFECRSFSCEATCDTAEATIMNSAAVASNTHWKDYLPGFKDWTATVEGVEPAAGGGIGAVGTEATLTLETSGGLAYSGGAICTGFGIANDAQDVASASFSFQGVSQLNAA